MNQRITLLAVLACLLFGAIPAFTQQGYVGVNEALEQLGGANVAPSRPSNCPPQIAMPLPRSTQNLNSTVFVGNRNPLGQPHGQGRVTWSTGEIYEGNFIDGNITGQGTKRFPDGAWYQGQFFNGLFHGHGQAVDKDRNAYQGAWVNGMRHGFGIFNSPQGWIYRGQFTNDQATGRGTVTFPNGQVLSGSFVNGQYVGP